MTTTKRLRNRLNACKSNHSVRTSLYSAQDMGGGNGELLLWLKHPFVSLYVQCCSPQPLDLHNSSEPNAQHMTVRTVLNAFLTCISGTRICGATCAAACSWMACQHTLNILGTPVQQLSILLKNCRNHHRSTTMQVWSNPPWCPWQRDCRTAPCACKSVSADTSSPQSYMYGRH